MKRMIHIFSPIMLSVLLLVSCNKEVKETGETTVVSAQIIGTESLVDGSSKEFSSFNIVPLECDYIYETDLIDNDIYMVVVKDYFNEDAKGQTTYAPKYSVQKSDMLGNVSLISKLDIDEAFGFCFIDSDTLAYVCNDGISLIDIKTGNVIKEITDAGLSSDSDIYSRDCVLDRCKDGFVASYTHRCVKYDMSGEETGRIYCEEFSHLGALHAYFEFSGKEYAASYSFSEIGFYELDFENEAYTKTRGSYLKLDSDTPYMCGTGNYLYQNGVNDVVCLSPTDEEYVVSAKDKNMLLTGVIGDEGDYCFDVLGSNLFVNIYNSTPIPQIRVIYEVSGLNLNSRQIIRASVASSVMTDPGLKSAVAEFNMSQSDYMIVLESEVFHDESGNDIQAEVIASLLKGDMPDLFIGSQFNPDYLAKAGLLEDLSDYVSSSELIGSDIKKLMLSGGNGCYYIFPGYLQDGYVGKGKTFTGIDPRIGSIQITDDLYGSQPAVMIADPVIRNELSVAGSSGGHVDQDRVEKILSYALKSGQSFYTGMYTMMDDVYSDNCKLARFNSSFSDFRHMYSELDGDIYYAGYPSVDEHLRPASCVCQVSVMADSEYKDAIYDFLDILLSYENQRQILCSQQGYTPVNDQVLEEYFNCLTDPQSIKDPIEEYWYEEATRIDESEISVSEIEQYKILKCSPNCIIDSEDSGLWNILFEEMDSYYSSNKSVNEIAMSLTARLNLYLDENYN